MAFRSIGVILAELTNDRSKLQAAADTAPRKKGGEPTGEESEGSPTLFVDAPTPSGSGIDVDGSLVGENSRPLSGAKVKEPSTPKRPVLLNLPVGKSMVAVSRRQQRQPHASAAIIDLAIWRQAHAPMLP